MPQTILKLEGDVVESCVFRNTIQVEHVENGADWSKSTIKCILRNEKLIMSIIGSRLAQKKRYYISNTDKNDLYQDFLNYMAQKDDRSKIELNELRDEDDDGEENILSYVKNCLDTFIIRYMSKRAEEARRMVSNIHKVYDDSDESYEEEFISPLNVEKEVHQKDVYMQLQSLEHLRTEYGFDIYMYIYLLIYGTIKGIGENKIFKALSICCKQSVKNIKDQRSKLSYNDDLVETVTSLIAVDDNTKLELLSQFLYGKEQIDLIVNNCTE